MMKIALNKLIKGEKGQVMILALILLLLGGLIIAPLLDYMGTGLKVGQVYEEKASDVYAADAGVEYDLWQIKYDHLATLFPDPINGYYPYDYTTAWSYNLPENVNDREVNVTTENVWIPKDLTPPTRTDAEHIIEGVGGEPPKLIIIGSVPAASTLQIKIYYYKDDADDPLQIETLGVWLPPGFHYDVEGECDLEVWLDDKGKDYSREITAHAGGEAVVWTFDSLLFTDLPNVKPLYWPMASTTTFPFTSSQEGGSPESVSWVNTNMDLSGGITYAWDADTKVYRIISEAYRDVSEPPSTTIEAYTIKSEIRELGSVIAGDYKAIGNSLMTDEEPFPVGPGGGPIRDTLLPESDVTVSDIPDDAEVAAAYLYWSGWFEEGGGPSGETIFFDDATDFNDPPMDWNNGNRWTISSGEFRGRGGSVSTEDRRLTMNDPINLSDYSGQTIIISWAQDDNGSMESSDYLYFALYNGSSWSSNIQAFRGDTTSPGTFSYPIPNDYLTSGFKMRFEVVSSSAFGDSIYIDDITIAVSAETSLEADETAIFKIDGVQVYFDGGVPTQGAGEITADSWQVVVNQSSYLPGTFFYASKKDVTELIRTFSAKAPDPATNHPGNATYTVGGVDATGDASSEIAYAGWSLIIIYASFETQGHQLYLFDTFFSSGQNNNVDFDDDGQPGGTISGFLVPEPVPGEVNASRMTAFVGEGDDYYNGDYLAFNGTKLWDGITTGGNSQSSPNDVWNDQSIGMSADGVDVDTFYVTWASGLLDPGDTSAQIDIWTDTDIWELVYIILSFRNVATTGGTVSYIIR